MLHSYEKILNRWFTSVLGHALLVAEKHWLAKHLPLMTGNVALQIGVTTDWLEASPIKKRFILFEEGVTLGPEDGVQVDFRALPLTPSSIDFMLVTHIMEGLPNPQSFLEEIYQALAPDGKLVIFSLNPYSLWGIQRVIDKNAKLPSGIEFCSPWQIKHWLHACGYRVIISESLFFRPLVNNQAALSNLLWMEAVGSFLYPGLGAVSVILAEKVEEGMTPLKLVDWLKKIFIRVECSEPSAGVSGYHNDSKKNQ